MKRFSIQYDKTLTQFTELKVNDSALLMIESKDPQIKISDEYHSFHELYQHRMALNIALFHSWYVEYGHESEWQVMKSTRHYDGSMFDGYFIVMAVTPHGQISYHYKLKHWDKFRIPEVERALPWDGHTSLQVMERLMKL